MIGNGEVRGEAGASLERDVTVKGRALIGARSHVGAAATLENVVIGSG
jgi:tetrahydrodipicolinate N-succinyltransferase